MNNSNWWYLRESQSIEKRSISAANIIDEELTSFFVKLNLALQLEEKQPLFAIVQQQYIKKS